MQKSYSPTGPSSRRPIRFGALLLAVGLIAAACSSSSSSSGDGSTPVGTDIDLAFSTFDGGTGNLTDYLGKPLVINFFAAWCPNCISEMPDFEAVHQELGDSVNFVGLSIDTAAADALDLIARTGITYDTGWDPDTSVYTAFGGFAMPTTIFVDSSGTIIEVFSGALSANALRDRIEQVT